MIDPTLLPYYDPAKSRKVALVTDAASGSGFYTVLHLYLHGFVVYIGHTTKEEGQLCVSQLVEETGLRWDPAVEEFIADYGQSGSTRRRLGECKLLQMDLLELQSVDKAVGRFKTMEQTLDLLVLNSDMRDTPYFRTISDDFEAQFQSNYVSLFLLSQLILPLVPNRGRVVYVSSIAHFLEPIHFSNDSDFDYEPNAFFTWLRYAKAKTCGIHYMKMLSRKRPDIDCYVVDPGSRFTNNVQSERLPVFLSLLIELLLAFVSFFIGVNEEDSAFPALFCLLSIDEEVLSKNRNGGYFTTYGCLSTPSPVAQSSHKADYNWNWSVNKLKEKGYDGLDIIT